MEFLLAHFLRVEENWWKFERKEGKVDVKLKEIWKL
jgi:hypothetical protein